MTDAERKTYNILFSEILSAARRVEEGADNLSFVGEIIGLSVAGVTMTDHFCEKPGELTIGGDQRMTDLWLARDSDGELWLYCSRPEWEDDDGQWWGGGTSDGGGNLVDGYGERFGWIAPGECVRLKVVREDEQ